MSPEVFPGRKSKGVMALLSLAGLIVPGLQRFYLDQKRWGWGYLVVGMGTLAIPPLQWVGIVVRILCLAEGLWILSMSNEDFDNRFNREVSGLEWASVQGRGSQDPEQQLEEMRRSGLITDAEYQEQRQRIRKIS